MCVYVREEREEGGRSVVCVREEREEGGRSVGTVFLSVLQTSVHFLENE